MKKQIPALPDAHRDDLPELSKAHAADLVPMDATLAKLGISKAEWAQIQKLPDYLQLYGTALADWNHPTNAEVRSRIKAGLVAEEALPVLSRRIHSPAEPLSSVSAAFKEVVKVAGSGFNERPPEAREPVTITINLGDSKPLRFEVTPKAIEHNDSDSTDGEAA